MMLRYVRLMRGIRSVIEKMIIEGRRGKDLLGM